jgi:hypothetical protein
MTFRDTQLGRFGELCTAHFGQHGDPDIRAAHALASNGVSSPARPTLQAVLGSKLLTENADPAWQAWMNHFSGILNTYQSNGGGPLTGECPKPWPPQPAGFCMHELTPPLRYWTMRSFVSRLRINNVIVRADGTIGIDPSVQPLWNYVLTRRGDILVAAEDFGWIKHTSIAGGQSVWVAGQVGIENGQLRMVDLQSGHYVLAGAAHITPGSALAAEIIKFTENAFRAYFQAFALPNLHPSFACVWA